MSSLQRFGRRIAECQDHILEQHQTHVLQDVRAALCDRLDEGRNVTRLRPLTLLAVSGTLVAAMALLVFLFYPSALTATVGQHDAPLSVGQWIGAPASSSLPIRFSDGSTIKLSPAAGGRITEMSDDGATLLLERGTAAVTVVHRPKTHWELDVGPYLVVVTGTRFVVSWDPIAEEISLRQDSGSVTVSGPMIPEGRSLVTGQQLTASVTKQEMAISVAERAVAAAAAADMVSKERVTEPADSVVEAPVVEMTKTPLKAPLRSSRQGPRPLVETKHAKTRPAAVDWRVLARVGRYYEALDVVAKMGFGKVLDSASAAELMLLADAARLERNWKWANRAYLKLRKRFPQTDTAAIAAFSLGRMAFDQHHLYGKAARWFERYLREQKDTSLTKEALGRLAEARQRSGDADGAADVARRYLSAYPDGPQASLMRTLVLGDTAALVE